MNNKKVFRVHMFLQTLKQTRLAGFIMMAVITLISVVPIISSLSYIKEYKQVNNVGGISGNYFLVLVFIIVVPVISLIVWSFLNKRSSSDFYHSIPYTRLCIYLSKTAAILTWIAGILVCHMYHRQFYSWLTGSILMWIMQQCSGCIFRYLYAAFYHGNYKCINIHYRKHIKQYMCYRTYNVSSKIYYVNGYRTDCVSWRNLHDK